MVNTLAAAKNAGRLKAELKKYTKPALLILDELGYLPIDKTGADLLFQVISLRYEQGAIIITRLLYFGEHRMNSHLAMVGCCLANKVEKISIACCPSWSCSWA